MQLSLDSFESNISKEELEKKREKKWNERKRRELIHYLMGYTVCDKGYWNTKIFDDWTMEDLVGEVKEDIEIREYLNLKNRYPSIERFLK